MTKQNMPFVYHLAGLSVAKKLSYRLILKKYSKSIIFEMLNIHLILIRDDESVEIISPKNIIKFLTSIKIKKR